MSESISIRHLVKRYPGAALGQHAVDGISIDIPSGQFITLLGPSGCGKTTTLRMIAGLEDPTSGHISFGATTIYSHDEGIEVPVHKRPIGMVFQSYAIWPHMNVFDNVAFPLRMEKPSFSREEIAERTQAALDLVGLRTYGSRPSTALSGGQQQRVALARALVRRPQILLLDEPLSNLDAKLREQMRDEIRDLQLRTGITTVFVTHDQGEALAVSDRILIMSGGRIVEDGTPQQIYCHPRSEFAADFIGIANKLTGRVNAVSGGVTTVTTPLGDIIFPPSATPIPEGAEVCAFVRPECLVLRDADRGWRGTVQRSVFQGDHTDYLVDVSGAHLRVRAYGSGAGPRAGDIVGVEIDTATIQLHVVGPPPAILTPLRTDNTLSHTSCLAQA